MSEKNTGLEEEIYKCGENLLSAMRLFQQSKYSLRSAEDKILEWSMRHEKLKVNLFRFVDVLPALNSSRDIVQHVHEYFRGVKDLIPLFKYALKVSPDSILSQGAAYATRYQVKKMSRRFIVGEDHKDAIPYLKALRVKGITHTVDLLGETALSEIESREYSERYLSLIKALHKKNTIWKERYPLKNEHPKDQSIVHVSIKLSPLYSQAKAINFNQSVKVLSERLSELLLEVKKLGGTAYIDMEDCSFTDITLAVAKKVFTSPEFKDYPNLGIVLQAYLKRTNHDLDNIIEWARTRSCPLQVRLVKGAYWDTEVILAEQNKWEIPVFLKKEYSDSSYEHLSRRLLDNHDIFYPAFASHNLRSIAHALTYAKHLSLSPSQFEIQALYGMGDEFKGGLIEQGYLVRDYSPVGELIPGMAYLVRRLLENTANEGFLRKTNFEKIDSKELLKAPIHFSEIENKKEEIMNQTPLKNLAEGQFSNLPFLDFTIEEERKQFQTAIDSIQESLKSKPFEVSPHYPGIDLASLEKRPPALVQLPEQTDITYSKTIEADSAVCDIVLTKLESSFTKWSRTTVEERAGILRRAAEIMISRRHELAALISFEAGKTWTEADADLAEGVDFCNYYADEAERIFKKRRMGNIQGEYNSYFYEARGTALIITPWNFALAIPCGMFAAALVCGNCAVLKPAEQTPFIAQKLFEIFLEAGLPNDVAAFLPGKGEEIGAFMAKDPRVSTINFTGSKEVGLALIKEGGNTHPDASHVKKVIAEMGGKNAIVIDSDADLDEAVKGVIHSAFAFQGQKCSACSRVYVVSIDTYERFKERLKGAVESIIIGKASDPASFMGPVISEESRDRILKVIQHSLANGSLVAKGTLSSDLESKGYYLPPYVFENLSDDDTIMKDEIFGPVLGIQMVESFKEGINKALSSKYRLTGGIFSRSPDNIEYAINEFKVGNLYINRSCTGALVYRQPFGGAHMSGVGAKAGGPDYLLQFVVPRTVTENTMRRGFAPETR